MQDRDMMYGGYYQNIPGSMSYGNFGYQGPPGALINQNNPFMESNNLNNNPLIDINARLSNLENRIKNLEQKINNKSYQDDNSLYMI